MEKKDNYFDGVISGVALSWCVVVITWITLYYTGHLHVYKELHCIW